MKYFKEIVEWADNLFKSNGKMPQPNNVQEDWEVEYHKIKDTAIMKSISICLMGDGGYKVINKGKPISSLMPMYIPAFTTNGIQSKKLKMTKSHCCRKCVEYYRNRVARQRSNTVVEEI